MTLDPSELSALARQEIQAYSRGKQSAEATGYNLCQHQLTLPGEPNPRAGDVIVWSKQLGYDIPEPSGEVVQAELKTLDQYRERYGLPRPSLD